MANSSGGRWADGCDRTARETVSKQITKKRKIVLEKHTQIKCEISRQSEKGHENKV